MKIILKTIGFMLVLALTFTSIPAAQVQAASKPVLSSSQVKINKNSCSVKKGRKIKLVARYGKEDITRKGTWKSSKKSVATISKTGVLTAKKAGTTYITVKYKGKTSKKLKVVVKANASSGSNSASGKGFTITYNKNSKNKSDKLKGPATQKVKTASGEILKFSTVVTPASGKKFLGWYDAPTGGNRIYETYKPTRNMTLYAHYTNKKTQRVTFSLGCRYGDDVVSFIGNGDGYDLTHNRTISGPVDFDNQFNVKWSHNYDMGSKDVFVIDDLPEPSVPGYTFKGWYTSEQVFDPIFEPTGNYGVKVENGQEIDSSVTRLYARFSKKITIHIDDLHGGNYPDIELDTYTSIADAGYKLPVLDIPGATFLGWSLNVDLGGSVHSNPVTNDKFFTNVLFTHGYLCTGSVTGEDDDLCYFKHYVDLGQHWLNAHGQVGGAYNDSAIYEEVNEITLYPMLKYHNLYLGFDPNGGSFSKNSTDNLGLTIYNEDSGDFKKGFGYVPGLIGDKPYGGPKQLPGHENQPGWSVGNMRTTMPLVTRNNYVFDKWIMPDGTEFTYDTILTENMVLTAKWIPGNCYVMFDPTDGDLTKEERDRVGLDGAWRYKVTTESSVSGSGKQLPVPVSSEGRAFEGWYTKDGERVDENTQILKDTTLYAHWGTKTDRKPETQKPSTDKDTTANKDTNSNNKNETVYATDITVTDMEWKPVDKNNNKYVVEYGGKGKQTGLGFTATVLPMELKDAARNVIWTSSDPNIISVTAGKEVIYSPNWFDYFEFGTDAGDVVLTVTSMDNPNVSFNINVTVIKK